MARGGRSSRRLPVYLIPIVIGMAGVLFSRQLDGPLLRGAVLLVSVAIPLFISGVIFTTIHVRRSERTLLLAGILLLAAGAAVTASGFADTLATMEEVPVAVIEASRWLGLLSLFIGLFATIYYVLRRGEELGEVAGRFRHVAQQMNEGLIVADADGRIALVNEQFFEITGLPRPGVEGCTLHDLGRLFEARGEPGWGEAFTETRTFDKELKWSQDGRELHVWVSVNPIRSQRGGHLGVLATLRDVTEQRTLADRLERYTQGLQELVEDRTLKLRESEELLRELLNRMNAGFLTLDSDFRIRYANEEICKLLGTAPGELADQEFFGFVDEQSRPKLLDLLEKASSHDETSQRRELRLKPAEGSPVSAMAAATAIHDATDRDLSYSIVLTDISDIKEMQRQLELRAAELEAANEGLRAHGRAKDSFLSNVSHELRTPLSTIRGYIEMLQSGSLGRLDDTQGNALTVMARNVQRLQTLIEEMIEFSRMQIRGIEVRRVMFAPGPLLEEAVSSAQPQMIGKDLTVEIDVPEGISPAWSDRHRLSQVLGILLSNAVKFSHQGGYIEVSAAARGDHTLAIAVRDTGVGIEPAHQAHVFNRFFQVDSSMTRKYEGTGIGLSIAKSIVEAHGGRIDLESAPGQGSTFTVVLPHALFDLGFEEEQDVLPESLSILLVEAQEESRRAIAALLGRRHEVREAVSGFEGLRFAAEQQPDLIVIDEHCGEMTATALIERMRQDVAVMQIPIVFSTSQVAQSEAQAVSMPGVFTLRKPFTGSELLKCIRDAWYHDSPESTPASRTPEVTSRPVVTALQMESHLAGWLEMAMRHKNAACRLATGVEGTAAGDRPPDVILVDLDGIGPDTGELLAQLAAQPQLENVPVYAVTGAPVQDGLGHGFAGVLRKPFAVGDVLALIPSSETGVEAPDKPSGEITGASGIS